MTAPVDTVSGFEKVREELVERRVTLLAALGDEVVQELDDGETAPEIDPADVLIRTSVRELDAAIARIDTRTYGLCDNCGGGIHEDRLAALPETAYCVECQARREL